MNGKLQESTLYLKGCNNLETETFRLYEKFSTKVNQPESSFILGFAYDSLKCAKTIQAILNYFDLAEIENMSCKKIFTELTSNVSELTKKIAKTNNVNYEMTCEILKASSILEDQLSEIYTSYLQSSLIRSISDELSPLAINFSNYKRIFEKFVDEKQKHKETILELIYACETKEADRLRTATPLVRYQNPDSWIREPTINSLSNAPTNQSTA